MHPSDMILEQSNDDEDETSFLQRQNQRRGIDCENISLIQEQVVQGDDEGQNEYRILMNEQEIGGPVKRSFFEENLASSERTSLKYGSPSPRGTGTYNSPDVHQHVSQMSVGAGLTDCSEAEEDEDTFDVEQPTDDEDIRQARI